MAKRKRRPQGKRKQRRKNPAWLAIRNPARRKRKARARPPRRRAAASPFPKGRTISAQELHALARRDPELARALRRYRAFHGADPDEIVTCEVPGASLSFRFGIALGDVRALEYEVPRSSGRSNGPPFRHPFRKGKQLAVTDPSGKALVIAKKPGSRMRVTHRGIVD